MDVYQELSKKVLGLDNVDNTSDLNKPTSTATQSLFDSLTDVNSLMQGLSWDSSTDVYTRKGSIKNIANSISAGDANLPIQSLMRRCVLKDDGTEAYLMDQDSPYMQDGVDEIDTGVLDTYVAQPKLICTGKTYLTSNVSVGDFVFILNSGLNKVTVIAKITAITSDIELALDTSISGDGSTFHIGNFDYLGTDGQVMVRIPKFYVYKDLVGTVHTWLISLYKLPGYEVHPAFIKNGVEVDYRYYSAFEGSMYDASASAMTASGSIATSLYAAGDKMCSVAMQWAKTNETLQEYRPMAQARGAGYEVTDINLNAAIQLLYLIEYADFNSQTMIGAGRTNLSGGTWVADSYIGKTGLSLIDGNVTNAVQNGTTLGYLTDYMTYRGIENFYGNVWKMIDNIGWDGRWTGAAAAQPVYITNDFSKLIDQSNKNLKKLVDAPYIGASAGYVGNIEDNLFFIPNDITGSSTIKLTDYYYQYSEVGRDFWRVLLFGGLATDGGGAGAFALDANNVWSGDYVAVAGRLCF
jgi:predicted heme/steroid binding protein